MAWDRVIREQQPRVSCGVDYGTERDVVLRRGEVMLLKTRSHTKGQDKWVGPMWYIRVSSSYQGNTGLQDEKGNHFVSKVTPQLWASWMEKLAQTMGLAVDQMPTTRPRGCTLVWRD